VVPVEMSADYTRNKYAFLRRRGMEVAYGRRVAELIRRERPEVVLSSNTPTEAQESIFRAAQWVGARFCYWVQDFYSLGVGKLLRRRLPVAGWVVGAWYRRLEGGQLRGSDRVVSITADFIPTMEREFGVDGSKIMTIPNWAPLESLPVHPKRNEWSEAHGLADRFVYLYSGTLGLKHNPALLLELARRNRDDDRIRVVVISEGLGAQWLRERAAAERLTGLVQLGYQPFEMMPQVLAAGDVLVGLLEEEASVFSVPSKVLTYLCAQRAILLAAPAVNLATRIVMRERAGMTVGPDDCGQFLDAAEHLRTEPGLAGVMGRRGRAYAEKYFQIGAIANRFEEALAPAVRRAGDELAGTGEPACVA
jgi:glycosyltransferase involved in cell wall biosynthesis